MSNPQHINSDLCIEEDGGEVFIDHPSTWDAIVRIPIEDIPKVIEVLTQIYDSYLLESKPNVKIQGS